MGIEEAIENIKEFAKILRQLDRQRTRKFEYTGQPALTRGDHGSPLKEGFEFDHSGYIEAWDAKMRGWYAMVDIETGLEAGDWKEISL